MQNTGKYSAPAGRQGHTVSLLLACNETSPHYSGDGGHFHVTLSAITVTPEGKPRNISDYDAPVVTPRGAFQLGGLELSSQGSRKDAPRLPGDEPKYDTRHLYGFEAQYSGYLRIRLAQATEIAKTLAVIDKRLTKASYDQGYAPNFAVWVRRVADALGISQITWLVSKGGNGHSYDDNTYRTVGIEAGCLFIEALETAWQSGKEGADLPLLPSRS